MGLKTGRNRVNPKATASEGARRLRRNWVRESPEEGARLSLPVDLQESAGAGGGGGGGPGTGRSYISQPTCDPRARRRARPGRRRRSPG
jgi:hypothetical protein